MWRLKGPTVQVPWHAHLKGHHSQRRPLGETEEVRLNINILSKFLTTCITVWYGNRVEKLWRQWWKQHSTSLASDSPTIKDIYHRRCLKKAHSILRDHSHPDCSSCYHQTDDTGACLHARPNWGTVTTRPQASQLTDRFISKFFDSLNGFLIFSNILDIFATWTYINNIFMFHYSLPSVCSAELTPVLVIYSYHIANLHWIYWLVVGGEMLKFLTPHITYSSLHILTFHVAAMVKLHFTLSLNFIDLC